MIKVMIVDDEPLIREGLKVIIDWKEYGFEVCEEAGNGREALEKLENQEIELIIVDIRMPQMNGLEFIQYVRDQIQKSMHFIILSGYNDFEYAKQAISNGVLDYLLKPIQAEELIQAIKKVHTLILEEQSKEQEFQSLIEGNMKSTLLSIALGKASERSIESMEQELSSNHIFRYCFIRMERKNQGQQIAGGNKRERMQQLSVEHKSNQIPPGLLEEKKEAEKRVIRAFQNHFSKKEYYLLEFQEVNDRVIEVGIVLLNVRDNNRDFYMIDRIHEELKEDRIFEYHYFIGIQVESLKKLNISYKTAVKASINLVLGETPPTICGYEKQKHKGGKQYMISYDRIQNILESVKENQIIELKKVITSIFKDFEEYLLDLDLIQTNIRYILYSIIDMAKATLSDTEEINSFLSPEIIEQIVYQADINTFMEKIISFSDYYYQLKHYSSSITLSKIVAEVEQNYMNNISLVDLSKKYFINNVYLGQIFKKEKGMSFKEYLNQVRIEKATEYLLNSNERIYSIGLKVGFQTPDYFISKFVQLKGTTPHQYRLKYGTKT